MAEQTAVNRRGVGSSPTSPASPLTEIKRTLARAHGHLSHIDRLMAELARQEEAYPKAGAALDGLLGRMASVSVKYFQELTDQYTE